MSARLRAEQEPKSTTMYNKKQKKINKINKKKKKRKKIKPLIAKRIEVSACSTFVHYNVVVYGCLTMNISPFIFSSVVVCPFWFLLYMVARRRISCKLFLIFTSHLKKKTKMQFVAHHLRSWLSRRMQSAQYESSSHFFEWCFFFFIIFQSCRFVKIAWWRDHLLWHASDH